MIVDIVIPALDEELGVGTVLRGLDDPRIRRVVVVDNGSADSTPEQARAAGAIVVREPQRGYGRACLTGLAFLAASPPDVVGFLDADGSDVPGDLSLLLDRIEAGADLVIGSRVAGHSERGALLPQARIGNWIATRLLRRIWHVEFTDLGPMRAVRWSALQRIQMRDEDFGWTVEMQVKAAQRGLRSDEVPVGYRVRRGRSKVTGTVIGSVRAGHKILWTIARERARGARSGSP